MGKDSNHAKTDQEAWEAREAYRSFNEAARSSDSKRNVDAQTKLSIYAIIFGNELMCVQSLVLWFLLLEPVTSIKEAFSPRSWGAKQGVLWQEVAS